MPQIDETDDETEGTLSRFCIVSFNIISNNICSFKDESAI